MDFVGPLADYDRYARSNLISELELVFNYVRLMRRHCQRMLGKSPSTDALFVIEQSALFELLTAKKERYLNERIYRDRYAARDHMLKLDLDLQLGSKYNEREFRIHYRMSRSSFMKLWHAIKDHSVFNDPKAKKQQVNSQYQLLILLKYLGTEGDAMSNQKARALFPSSSGSFDDMKNRVIVSIIDNLSETSYFWPNNDER